MELSPLYLDRLQSATEQGIQRGIQEGIQQEKRLSIEAMLQVKFGEIDGELSQIVDRLLELPALDRTQLIMQLSREELLSRFQD